MVTRWLSMTHFWTFWALKKLPKGRFMSKASCFEAPNSPKSGLLTPKQVTTWSNMTIFGPEYFMWVVTTGKNPLLTQYMEFFGHSKVPKGLVLLI